MDIGIDLRSLMSGRISGVEVYVINLLRNLFELDPQNHYFLYYNSFRKVEQNLPQFDYPNVELIGTRIPNKFLNLSLRFFHWPKIDLLMAKKLKKKKPLACFLVPDPRPTALSKKVKKITTFHDLSFHHFPQNFNFKTRLWHLILNAEKEARTSLILIAVSHFTKNDLMKTYQIPDEKIKVIYEGVDEDLKPEERKAVLDSVRAKYYLPHQFFLTFSTLEPRKNLVNLIKAFLLFRKKHPETNLKLVIAGVPNQRIFRKIVLEKNEDLFFTGFVEEKDKGALFSLASGFLLVSNYEGFGLPLLEAMKCGVPIITSNSSALPEVAGEAAVLVDPYDLASIASGMEKLLNEKTVSKLRQKGFERVKEFSWKKCAASTLKLFTSLS